MKYLLMAIFLFVASNAFANEVDLYMVDPYGNSRMYSERHLTVDHTYQNSTLLRMMRKQRALKSVKGWPKPRTNTHNGNGYRYGF